VERQSLLVRPDKGSIPFAPIHCFRKAASVHTNSVFIGKYLTYFDHLTVLAFISKLLLQIEIRASL
jgi:hypothetical protein